MSTGAILIKLITKAIDTTYISYQPLWLCCWRGDISIFFHFFVYKKLDPNSSYLSRVSSLRQVE